MSIPAWDDVRVGVLFTFLRPGAPDAHLFFLCFHAISPSFAFIYSHSGSLGIGLDDKGKGSRSIFLYRASPPTQKD